MSSSNGTTSSSVGPHQPVDHDEALHLAGVTSRDDSCLLLNLGRYVFKCAETEEEFEQIHRLNYRTFVEEVGQYPDNGSDQLVDKFHDKNRYFIALENGHVIGMLAVHSEPPFSITDRLHDTAALDGLGDRIMEVRLFAIEPDKRYGPVSRGLLWLMYEWAQLRGYTHLVISGIASRMRLYERMGFEPLGDPVECGDASFVPMAMSFSSIPENIRKDARRVRERVKETAVDRDHPPVSLLPGPVQIADEIRHAVSQRPVSHRGEEFIERYERIRDILSDMVGGLETVMMVGSGTLGNEVVGATIHANRRFRRGMVLVNGEFGRRLAAQARRYNLDFEVLAFEWGQPWDAEGIRAALARDARIDWIWATHLETSTGRMNDINTLFNLGEEFDAAVCLDCVSSLGASDMNISRAHLATGVSGKAIGALAGLAFMFVGDGALEHVDSSRVPTYLDLQAAIETVGPRFTVSSPLLNALDCAVKAFATPQARRERYQKHADLGRYVRKRLTQLGLPPLIDDEWASPVITSFRPPRGVTSVDFYERCLEWGFEISGLSGYLLERGFLQIATMGAVTQRDCAQLFARLRHWRNEWTAHATV
ncbi:MAG: aminotransferase class V-fold PLP-dependent enzyme [Phycisphaerales bacterium]